MSRIEDLEARLGHSFQDRSLVDLALTHRSARPLHNERLEFLGDSVLGLVVAEALYRESPDCSEGDLSRMRAALVNRQVLANIAAELGLGEVLVLGPGERKSGGRERASILADAVEALFGAIYLDGGLDSCRNTILKLLLPHRPQGDTVQVHKDSKTRLQELLQAQGKGVPQYQVEQISGEAHEQKFLVSCRISLLAKPTQGSGNSRRSAEQQAAARALQLLGA